MIHEISNKTLTIDYLGSLFMSSSKLNLSRESQSQIAQGRIYLEEKIKTVIDQFMASIQDSVLCIIFLSVQKIWKSCNIILSCLMPVEWVI